MVIFINTVVAMFQDLPCHMRLVKDRFTFCSAQTNAAFVKCKLAAIID